MSAGSPLLNCPRIVPGRLSSIRIGLGLGGRSVGPVLGSSPRWLVWRGWEADTIGHDGVVDAGGVHQPA
jgi:hypothetical protein